MLKEFWYTDLQNVIVEIVAKKKGAFCAMRNSYFPYKELNTRNHGRMLEGLQRKDVKESVKWLQTDLNEAANLISLEFERGKQ